MFSKKALSAAIAGSIAAGFVTSSQAIVYVNPTEAVTTTIASPTVLGTNNVIINGVGANDFRLSGSDSFGTALNPVYVKVTLTNATFNAAVDSPAFGDGTNGLVVASQITTPFVGSGLTGQRSVTFVSGGAAGGSTVTYQVANPGASDDFTFDMPSLRTSGTSNVEVKVEVLDSLSATSALKTFTLTNSAGAVPLITLTDNVISSGASSQTLTAAVANQFKQFSSNGGNLGGTRGTFGTASFGVVSSAFVASTGAAAASIDTLASDTSSVVTVSGDLSVGTWYFAAAGGTNCAGSTAAGATAITLNTAKTSGTTTLASFRGTAATNPERTLCVDHNGTTAIPLNSAITVALTPAKANSLAIATPATPATRTLGVVTRDGTTVQRQEYRSSSCMSLLSVTALKRTKNIVANDDVEFAVAA